MSVKANKKSLKQQGGAMIPEAPGMMEMPQQPQQPKVNPEVMQIAQMIKSSVNEGNELIDIVKGLMQEEVDQQLIGQALMMGGIEEEDIITIFETASTPPQPSAPEEVDREPQLLARNRDIAKREREQAEQAQSQEQEVDISEQVRTLAKSGIEIKPENEGKFTAWAKKRGMGVQEAARKVLANKGKYPPSVVKMANFARNAAKWKKEEGGEFEPHMMYDTKTGKAYKANKPADHEKYKKLGYLHKDELKKAKDGVDMPAGQYVNGVFIPDESEVDKSMLSQNLQRPANFYMSDNHYAVAPLSPPPETNVLADFISTAAGINQDLFSNEVDDYGNRKGALKDVFKRGDGKFLGIKFGEGNPDPDAGSGMSKMEMHKMLKPFYYDTTIDTSQITSPENIKAYTDWAMQQKKEWDSNTQEQLDEQASVIENVSGQSAEQDNRTFGEWAKDAGHDIVKMSENAVNLLQNLWKKTTGKMETGGGTDNAGFKALPLFVQGKILSGMDMGGENDYLANRDKVIKRAIARQKGKAQDGGEESPERQAYRKAYDEMVQKRNAIGENDQEALAYFGSLVKDYNENDLVRDYKDLQRLRQNAGFSNAETLYEDAKITFPHVGQQIRGAFNQILGTNFEEGGEKGEAAYLANRDRVIKREMAKDQGGELPMMQFAGQPGPGMGGPGFNPYTDDFEEYLMGMGQTNYMDFPTAPGSGAPVAEQEPVEVVQQPTADELFEKINFEPEVNVSNKIEGTVNRLADNPIVGAFASLSDAAVKTARFANDRFDEKAYRDALDKMEERSGADYKFAVQTSDPMSQGFYDANTGQLQGEAERTAGYYGSFAASPYSFGMAQDGLETKPGFVYDKKMKEKFGEDYSNMSPEQIMFIQQFLDRERESNAPTNMQLFSNDSTNINRPVTDGVMGKQTFKKPTKETGGEIVELSQDMIAQLIAAGADIEII